VNTSLEHLPEHKQKQLKEITGIIVKAVDPEKVILFGSHATGRWVEHRYTEGGITYEYISDYDILVITQSGESRKDYEVQDVIENRCVYKTPVTVITHDIDFVNKMLSEGQYFFTDIEQEGILLYDAGNTPLAERKPLSPAEAKAIAQHYYEQWFYSAQAFLKIAGYCLQEGDLKEGAFNLHHRCAVFAADAIKTHASWATPHLSWFCPAPQSCPPLLPLPAAKPPAAQLLIDVRHLPVAGSLFDLFASAGATAEHSGRSGG
jgi:predicted nucleotidyltransferase